jgi:photosystem II stability/assembly factor-like uncharacterized protein
LECPAISHTFFVRADLSNRIFRFPAVIFAVCCLLLTHVAGATDLTALSRPAIAVKVPDKVVLIAIANAGNRLVAVGVHGVIIYSDDNGQNWHQAKVPVDLTLTAVRFADSRNGWAVGHFGVILHSTDGGATWQKQLDGNQVNQMTMATAQAAVADNDPSVGTARSMARANHFIAGGPENPFLTILALNANNVIVFGAYRMAEMSTDGGKDWSDWNLHIGDPISHNLYDVTRVGADIYLVGEAGSVFISTDNGASFRGATTPAPSTLFVVLPTGDGGVFTCGVAGLAFRSADKGQSWTPINFNTTSNLTAGAVLANGAMIIGNEAGAVAISTDHAKSFSVLPGFQPMQIFGLAQASNGNVVAVGSAGVIVIPAKDFL